MRVSNRRLVVPVAIVVAFLVPAAATATATTAHTPKSQRLTGIVQTVVREQPPGDRTPAADGAATDTTKVLQVGKKIVPLTEGSLPATKNGAKVSIAVAPAVNGASPVLSAETIAAPVAAAVAPTHQVYVALVLPIGLAADPSLTDASTRAMVNTVSQYWSSQTGGQVSFSTAQVLPAYRSAYSCTGAQTDTYNMWAEASARMPAASGPGRHLVLVAPGGADTHGCSYGLGTIGAVNSTGNQVFVSGLDQSLLAHELGHNLGLYHSNSLRCSGVQDTAVVAQAFAGCQANPYDDLFDVMGYSGPNYGEGNLNAVHLNGMNLLPNAVRKIAAASGVTTARIAPLSAPLSAGTVSRTLKITDPTGALYFVEYRTNSGRDSRAGLTFFKPSWGVRVLRDDPQAPVSAGSYELDATPTSLLADDYNRSIPVGGTFTAASRKLTIRVTAQDPTGASLTITNWPTPIVPSGATLSIPTHALVGAAVTAATRVSDQHGGPVANWPVTLQRLQRGTTTWRGVQSLRTTSAGTTSFRFANPLSSVYRWVTSAAAGAPTRISPNVSMTSTARVVERRPATSLTHGTYLSVSGSISAVPAPVVYLQYRYTGGTWQTGPRASVSGTAVSVRMLMRTRGIAYIRLYIKAATPYAGSVSGAYVTTVR